jgi:hypothetical protein
MDMTRKFSIGTLGMVLIAGACLYAAHGPSRAAGGGASTLAKDTDATAQAAQAASGASAPRHGKPHRGAKQRGQETQGPGNRQDGNTTPGAGDLQRGGGSPTQGGVNQPR